MHWVAEMMLHSCLPGSELGMFEAAAFTNVSDPDGTVITEDIYAYAAEYAMRVLEVVGGDFDLSTLRVEHTLPRDHLGQGLPVAVIDAWLFDAATMTVYVFDAKFGHRYVSAEDNWQFVDYAAAIMEHLNINGANDTRVRFVFEIVQPRCFHSGEGAQKWVVVASDLRAQINHLRTQIAFIHNGKVDARTGSHCLGCSAAHFCPASAQAGASILEYVVGYPTPNPLDAAALSLEKTLMDYAAKIIKSRLSGLDAELESRIHGGELIPGYRVEATLGNRAWSVDIESLKGLGEAYDVCLTTEKPVTPAAAERISKKAGRVIDEDVISAYTHRPSAGNKIVRDDLTRAQKIFS